MYSDSSLSQVKSESAGDCINSFLEELWQGPAEKNELPSLGKFLSQKIERNEIKRTISDTSNEYVFHGTAADFAQVLPKPNLRTDRSGNVIWSGSGVFASDDRRVAVIYTDRRSPGYGQGVDLVNKTSPNEPLALHVTGGESKEDALDKLYGPVAESKGYIHMLDANGFSREPGLGQMEVVSRETPNYHKVPEFPNGIQTINPRKEIDAYVKSGEMKVIWHHQW